jgi:hypothetical protein
MRQESGYSDERSANTWQSPNIEVGLEEKPSGLVHLKFREQAHNMFSYQRTSLE